MPAITPRHLQILTALCNLPTAPYREQHVIAWLLHWAHQHQNHIRICHDKAGNLYLHYQRGPARKRQCPLFIEAHMDHPGFVLTHQSKNGTLHAQFRGGVRPSHFKKAAAQFWIDSENRWLPAKILTVKKLPNTDFLAVTLAPLKSQISNFKSPLPPGTLGMWNLPDAKTHRDIFAARVCDDIAGIAAMICLLEELIARKIPARLTCLCSRAEEVGFAGVLAACHLGTIPKSAAVIGLETSKGSANAPQGSGPIIRVGDKTGLFSPGLSHFITQSAGHLADAAPAKKPFLYQRKLMDGGTCNSTAFAAFGYDSAALCVALGNYHNQSIKGDAGYGHGSKAGPGIASETIHLRDFEGLVQILVETVRRFPAYQPGMAPIRDRLAKLHQKQKTLLYTTGPTV